MVPQALALRSAAARSLSRRCRTETAREPARPSWRRSSVRSASDGERRAAEWLVARYAELGAEARIEAERRPRHLLVAARDRRGGRRRSAASRRCAAAGCSAAAARGARRRRARRRVSARASAGCARLLPSATTHNVVCELGPGRRRADRGRSSPTTTPPTPGSSSIPAIPETADRLRADRADRHQPAADGAGRRRRRCSPRRRR